MNCLPNANVKKEYHSAKLCPEGENAFFADNSFHLPPITPNGYNPLENEKMGKWHLPFIEGVQTTDGFRVGIGHDTHRLRPGGPLRLGGIDIPHDREAVGHSDADSLLHAVIDALLGAAALGDIGQMFPDTDAENRGRDSAEMLQTALASVATLGWKIVNIDCIVFLASQTPHPSPGHSRATGRHPGHRSRTRRPASQDGRRHWSRRPRGSRRRPVCGAAGSEGIKK